MNLFEAAEKGNLVCVKYLIEKEKVDIHANHDSALRWAACNGHLKVVKYLISKGAYIHVGNDYALKWSFFYERPKIVKYLLQQGANIKVLPKKEQIKYKKYGSVKLIIFLLDFHYKRETELSKNEIADINVLSIVFSFH